MSFFEVTLTYNEKTLIEKTIGFDKNVLKRDATEELFLFPKELIF